MLISRRPQFSSATLLFACRSIHATYFPVLKDRSKEPRHSSDLPSIVSPIIVLPFLHFVCSRSIIYAQYLPQGRSIFNRSAILPRTTGTRVSYRITVLTFPAMTPDVLEQLMVQLFRYLGPSTQITLTVASVACMHYVGRHTIESHLCDHRCVAGMLLCDCQSMFVPSSHHSRFFQPSFQPSAWLSFTFPCLWFRLDLSLPVVDTMVRNFIPPFEMMRCVVTGSLLGFF
jgi:hypothetical protein